MAANQHGTVKLIEVASAVSEEETEMAPVPAERLLLSPCHPPKSSHLPEEISFWLSRASKHFRS
jgi:hypothetical protein